MVDGDVSSRVSHRDGWSLGSDGYMMIPVILDGV